jgi:NADPH:quinone reductase-like Zn-dependent oxidoreductase
MPAPVRCASTSASGVNCRHGAHGPHPDAPKLPCVVGWSRARWTRSATVTGVAGGDHVIAPTRFGGYADTVIVPANQVVSFPPA